VYSAVLEDVLGTSAGKVISKWSTKLSVIKRV
jgi:hypothetical protein